MSQSLLQAPSPPPPPSQQQEQPQPQQSSPQPIPLAFGGYDLQVGGHGQTDDTGLLTLFDGNVICKPIGMDHRAYLELMFYRDLAISLATKGGKELDFSSDLTPLSPLPIPSPSTIIHNNNNNINDGDENTVTTTTTHFGWFGSDHVPDWYQYDQHNHQIHFLHLLSQTHWEMLLNQAITTVNTTTTTNDKVNNDDNTLGLTQTNSLSTISGLSTLATLTSIDSSSLSSSTTQLPLPQSYQTTLQFLINNQLPVNPLPPQNHPLQQPSKQQQLYFAWYYRSLLSKLKIYPIPIGSIIKHIISSSGSIPCYPISPYDKPVVAQINNNSNENNDNNNNNGTTLKPNSHIIKPYLALQSLTSFYSNPAVIDIKMGQNSWGFSAKYDKMSYELVKYPFQHEFGFRIVGANLPVIYPHYTSQLNVDNNNNGDNNNNNNNIPLLIPTNEFTLGAKIKINRKVGQSLLTSESILQQLQELFKALLIPKLNNVINNKEDGITTTNNNSNTNNSNDVNPTISSKPSCYSHLNDIEYEFLYQQRIEMVNDLIICCTQQFQELLLLLTLYPTHHSVANSILMTFEAHPGKCIELINAWKQQKLLQYKRLISQGKCQDVKNDDNNNNNINWTNVLNSTHQHYLLSLIQQYDNDCKWFSPHNNNNNTCNNNTSQQHEQDEFTSLFNSIPLPITVKMIDFAHVWDPIEHRKELNVFTKSTCQPSIIPPNQIKPLAHMEQLPGIIPTPLATVYRHEYTSNNCIYIDNVETFEKTGILQCQHCHSTNHLNRNTTNGTNDNNKNNPTAASITALPSILPRQYCLNTLKREFDIHYGNDIDIKDTNCDNNNNNNNNNNGDTKSKNENNNDNVIVEMKNDPQYNPNFDISIQSRTIIYELYQQAMKITQNNSDNGKNNNNLKQFSHDYFKSVDIGWDIVHLCPNHHQYVLTPKFVQELINNNQNYYNNDGGVEEKNIQTNNSSLPVIIPLIPLVVSKQLRSTLELHNKQNELKNPFCIARLQFQQDHSQLNAIKTLLAFMLILQRHGLQQ